MNTPTTNKLTILKLKELMAKLLGIEPDDIDNDFSLREDLHMKAVEMSEFIQKLNDEGINTDQLDFTDIETVNDLIDALSLND